MPLWFECENAVIFKGEVFHSHFYCLAATVAVVMKKHIYIKIREIL
jgi:hypothetical protein